MLSAGAWLVTPQRLLDSPVTAKEDDPGWKIKVQELGVNVSRVKVDPGARVRLIWSQIMKLGTVLVMILTSVISCRNGGEATTMSASADQPNEVVQWLHEMDFGDADHIRGVDALSSRPSYEEWLRKGRGIPQIRTILTTLLTSKDPQVDRAQVAYAIGWLGDAQSVPSLIDALGDKDVRLRIESAAALGQLKDSAAIDALCTALATDPDSNVRANAAVALGSFRGEKVRSSLKRALLDRSQFVREMANESLDRIARAGTQPNGQRGD